MCAIVDANAAHEVFGLEGRPEAGKQFFEWINHGSGRVVAGGKLLDELQRTKFQSWARQALLSGRMSRVDAVDVDARAKKLEDTGSCTSNDAHVIALAKISGARLLYSNDRKLWKDFHDKTLIDPER